MKTPASKSVENTMTRTQPVRLKYVVSIEELTEGVAIAARASAREMPSASQASDHPIVGLFQETILSS